MLIYKPGLQQGNVYSPVSLPATESAFGTSLENLAKTSSCSESSGHTLAYDVSSGKITVSFVDKPTYFPNAGTFVIYSYDKVKQIF